MFAVRIVTADYYMANPLKDLDVCYSEFRENQVKRVPVVRIFGATPAGQKTCLHLHGIFPYIYVPYDGYRQQPERYLRQVAFSIDRAINVSMGNPSSSVQPWETLPPASSMYSKCHWCLEYDAGGTPKDGSINSSFKLKRSMWRSPSTSKVQLSDSTLEGAFVRWEEEAIPSSLVLEGVEKQSTCELEADAVAADILNRLEIENDAGGTPKDGSINSSFKLKRSMWRSPSTSKVQLSDSTLEGAFVRWEEEAIPSSLVLEGVEKQSTCELEADAVAADILNRLEIETQIGRNPGLQAIWEDEKQRRRDNNESSRIEASESQDRGFVASTESERIFLKRLKEILRQNDFSVSLSESVEDDEESDMFPVELSLHSDLLTPEALQCTPANLVEVHKDSQPETKNMTVDEVAIVDEEAILSLLESSQTFQSSSQRLIQSPIPESGQDHSLVHLLAGLEEDGYQAERPRDSAQQRLSRICCQPQNSDDEEAEPELEKEEAELSLVMSQRWDSDVPDRHFKHRLSGTNVNDSSSSEEPEFSEEEMDWSGKLSLFPSSGGGGNNSSSPSAGGGGNNGPTPSSEEPEFSEEEMDWSGKLSLFTNLSIPQLDGAADEHSGVRMPSVISCLMYPVVSIDCEGRSPPKYSLTLSPKTQTSKEKKPRNRKKNPAKKEEPVQTDCPLSDDSPVFPSDPGFESCYSFEDSLSPELPHNYNFDINTIGQTEFCSLYMGSQFVLADKNLPHKFLSDVIQEPVSAFALGLESMGDRLPSASEEFQHHRGAEWLRTGPLSPDLFDRSSAESREVLHTHLSAALLDSDSGRELAAARIVRSRQSIDSISKNHCFSPLQICSQGLFDDGKDPLTSFDPFLPLPLNNISFVDLLGSPTEDLVEGSEALTATPSSSPRSISSLSQLKSGSHTLRSTGGAHILKPLMSPPSRDEIMSTLLDLDLAETAYQEPFCSDPSDAPGKPREIGGRVLTVETKLADKLSEFEGDFSSEGLQFWKTAFSLMTQPGSPTTNRGGPFDSVRGDKNRHLASTNDQKVVVMPCKSAPSRQRVQLWVQAKKEYDRCQREGKEKKEAELPVQLAAVSVASVEEPAKTAEVHNNTAVDAKTSSLLPAVHPGRESGDLSLLLQLSPVKSSDTENSPGDNRAKPLEDLRETGEEDGDYCGNYRSPDSPVLPPWQQTVSPESSSRDFDEGEEKGKRFELRSPSEATHVSPEPEIGGRVLTVETKLADKLSEFEGDFFSEGLQFWKTAFSLMTQPGSPTTNRGGPFDSVRGDKNRHLASTNDQKVVVMPCKSAPSRQRVQLWVQAKKEYDRCQREGKEKKEAELPVQLAAVSVASVEEPAKTAEVHNNTAVDAKTSSLLPAVHPGRESGDLSLLLQLSPVKSSDTENSPGDNRAKPLEDLRETGEEDGDYCGNYRSPDSPVLPPWQQTVSPESSSRDFDEGEEKGKRFELRSPRLLETHTDTLLSSQGSQLTQRRQDKQLLSPCTLSHKPEAAGKASPTQLHSTPVHQRNISEPRSQKLSQRRGSKANTLRRNQFAALNVPKKDSSQIEGPSLNNSYGFKVSMQNLQDAKALHEVQYLTLLSMELHASTRRGLEPDPDFDPICALFYCITSDALLPDTDNTELCGAIVVDKDHGTFGQGDWKDNRFSAERDEYGADTMTEINIVGRIVLNVWRMMKTEVTLTSYSFENVAFHVLHQRFPLYTPRVLSDWFDSKTDLYRWKVVDHYISRVRGTLQLLEQHDLISRTSELARLFGIQFYHVLTRGSQYRVESMMLRIAKPLNYIPITPSTQQRVQMRSPQCIPLIMEPESRFYSNSVVVLDFQSLYPSIVIAYNYCFSTCLGHVEHLGR
ncbi:UNVERIFIED_CONTAM: hypothetical protein FKN15_021091 [Acipenser sinensis]